MDYLNYILKSALTLAVFYICWRLLMGRDTLHRANRVILLSIALGSFVLPLPLISISNSSLADSGFIPQLAQSISTAQNGAVLPSAQDTSVGAGIYLRILMAVYIAGVVAVMAWSIMSIVHILGLRRKGRQQTMEDGTQAVITDTVVIPFSWMKWIFISEEDCAQPNGPIFRHEKAHLALRHSYDVLCIGIMTALQWFNPAMWLLRRDLLLVHEYEADAFVLKSGTDARQYQRLMLGRAVGRDLNAVTNGFSHSAVKSRIDMMLKKPSGKRASCKVLAFVPLVLACLILSANVESSYVFYNDRAAAEFEENFIKSRIDALGRDDALWLVGYRTAVYHGQDSVAVMEVWRQNREEIEKEGNVYLMPGAARFYFGLANAVVEYDGKRYVADGNGVVAGLKVSRGKRIVVTGTAASESGKATEFGIPKQSKATYVKYNTVVFDIGELFE